MNLLNKIQKICDKYNKVAMFIDMDGVIASFDIDINKSIINNTKGYFLDKKPIKSVIDQLEKISHIKNIDLYILSACVYKEQAKEKIEWIKKYASFFKEENLLFLIKEISNYTQENKANLKTNFIVQKMVKLNYDKVIYLEDEYLMLQKAYKKLSNKLICIHISELLD